MKLTIEHDECNESPCEYGPWDVKSFNNRHISFQHPDELFPLSIGLRRKLAVGTAFVLSCYSHGNVAWAIKGEGFQCRWDTAQVAGIMVCKEDVKHLPKTLAERTELARNFLDTYNSWCNGEVYYYRLESETPCKSCGKPELEEIDSCGGYYGSEHLMGSLRDEHPEVFADDAVVNLAGEASHVFG